MAVDFSNTLIVAISATALFDLTESENYLLELLEQRPANAIKEFREYMTERENDPLNIGAGYPLIKALLNVNKYSSSLEVNCVSTSSELAPGNDPMTSPVRVVKLGNSFRDILNSPISPIINKVKANARGKALCFIPHSIRFPFFFINYLLRTFTGVLLVSL